MPMVHPEAQIRMMWLALGFAFIVYEAFAIPIYIAFEVNPEGGLFAWVSSINVYFFVDIGLQFFFGYMDQLGNVVAEPKRVAYAYATGWLVPDLAASIPWEWIPLDASGGDARVTKSARFVRTFRLLRLLRLVRVAKLGLFAAKVEIWLESNEVFLFALGILRIIGVLCAISHWSACIWYAVGTDSHYGEEYAKGYPVSWVAVYQDTYPFIGEDKAHHYVYSLYFCLTTMATVGYGDISPKNYNEVRFAMALLVFSTVVFASLTGTLMNMIAALSSRRRALTEKKVALGRYMNFRAVPWKLMMSVRQHLIFQWDATEGYDAYEAEVKAQLSPTLKEELCRHIYSGVLDAAPFLAWMQDYPTCTKYLAEKVRCTFLTPGDHVFRMGQANAQIYMLLSGTVVVSRIEHLFDQDADRASEHTGDVLAAFGLPRSKEGTARSLASHASLRSLSQLGNQLSGLHTFDSEVLQKASMELRLADLRRMAAARTVQRMWRSKQANRRARGEVRKVAAPTSEQWLERHRMRRTNITAPAYFGESCLWQPLKDWDTVPPPPYMYTARCVSLGEFAYIPRDAVKGMLERFDPWIPERLELFREALQKKVADMMQGDEAFKRLAMDWATVA